jgi:class 3 adenylate cyclase
LAADFQAPPAFREFQLNNPIPPDRGSLVGRVALERRAVHIPDVLADPEYTWRRSEELGGFRTMLGVPMLRDGEPIGVFILWRVEVRPFSERQMQLVTTFADQALIATENTRLFQELQERTADLAELNRTLEGRVSKQVEELERVGRLRRYLSPQLVDLIVSSGNESMLDSHRRQITVVFCDLRGFTAFAETAEPEEVMSVLGEYHAALGELIRRFEGTIEHLAGDGLMVFFNDPLPQPDHTERAVRMAVAMHGRVAELARGWLKQGYELGFGVGIAMGYATLGQIGFEGRFEYGAIGTVSNLAARLCGEALGGQTLISGRVHRVIEELVEVEYIGELTLKGFHRPVAAFNVVGIKEAESAESTEARDMAKSDSAKIE